LDVPKAKEVVVASGRQGLAVAAESETEHFFGMPHRFAFGHLSLRVPEACFANWLEILGSKAQQRVPATGGQELAIRTEGQSPHAHRSRHAMRHGLASHFPLGNVPKNGAALIIAGRQEYPIGAEHGAPNLAAGGYRLATRKARLSVPEMHAAFAP